MGEIRDERLVIDAFKQAFELLDAFECNRGAKGFAKRVKLFASILRGQMAYDELVVETIREFGWDSKRYLCDDDQSLGEGNRG